MPRNADLHFATLPRITGKRSRFDLSHRKLTTCITGTIIPLNFEEIIPGDTPNNFTIKKLVRGLTPIHPVMDNAYLDTYTFFVPLRIIWDDFEKFLGANDDAWFQNVEYVCPKYEIGYVATGVGVQNHCEPESLANYLGIPAGFFGYVNALPFRAYWQIYNDFFRDQNFDSIIAFSKQSGTFGDNQPGAYGTIATFNGEAQNIFANFKTLMDEEADDFGLVHETLGLKFANKFQDVFTTCLPAPQKGASVLIPIGSTAPVLGDSKLHNIGTYGYRFDDVGTSLLGTDEDNTQLSFVSGSVGDDDVSISFDTSVKKSNLVASVEPGTIDALVLALKTQQLLRQDAVFGTRYVEILRGQWGLMTNDAILQRAQYLGGERMPLQIAEVMQNSPGAATPLGDSAGLSKTFGSERIKDHSFTEHGILMTVGVIRTDQTYSTGIRKYFQKENRLDFYVPILANIGEQPVYDSEIGVATDTENVVLKGDVWGYQEAWYDYRYHANEISGYMQPGISGTLASWHYGSAFDKNTYLSSAWLKQSPFEVDRTIAVSSSVGTQWLLDLYFELYMTRLMPVYSQLSMKERW